MCQCHASAKAIGAECCAALSGDFHQMLACGTACLGGCCMVTACRRESPITHPLEIPNHLRKGVFQQEAYLGSLLLQSRFCDAVFHCMHGFCRDFVVNFAVDFSVDFLSFV